MDSTKKKQQDHLINRALRQNKIDTLQSLFYLLKKNTITIELCDFCFTIIDWWVKNRQYDDNTGSQEQEHQDHFK